MFLFLFCEGVYAYLETSKKVKDRRATLMTPTYAGSFSECVMEFYYHMKGKDIGILQVDLQPTSKVFLDQARLFELRGRIIVICTIVWWLLFK